MAKSWREEGGTIGVDANTTGSDRLRAPSKLHSFNRYELKYLVPTDQVDDIRSELNDRMKRDDYAGPSGYGVWSVYYDTEKLRFYYEKIEGLKFRRKLRIRRYGETTGAPERVRSGGGSGAL